jgi:hypothetical protein
VDAEAEQRLRRVDLGSDAQHPLEALGVGDDRGPVLLCDAGERLVSLLLQVDRKVDLAELKCGIVLEELVERRALVEGDEVARVMRPESAVVG